MKKTIHKVYVNWIRQTLELYPDVTFKVLTERADIGDIVAYNGDVQVGYWKLEPEGHGVIDHP